MVVIEKLEKDNYEVTFRLGRNAQENHELIDDADPDDLWFHLEGHPSGHCILEVNQKESKENSNNYNIDTVDIIFAANLVKSYSKLKNHNKKLKVIYTPVKNLKKGKAKGEVIMMNLKKVSFIMI
jgi:predicted ribosome quality control (RQC) complex YloA/Tae2 family protein